MDRREFLKGSVAIGGAVGGLVLLGAVRNGGPLEPTASGTTPTPSAATETPTAQAGEPPRYADEYDTVVDAVAAGADPDGEEPINDVLTAEAGDDTLLSFPPGSYRIQPLTLADHTRFAIAGASETRPTFFGDPGSFSGTGRFLIFDEITDFRLDGIDFDFCRGENGGKLTVRTRGDSVISDVTVAASCARDLQVLGISVRDPAGTGVVENFRAIDEGDSEGLTAVYVGKAHSGDLRFRRCELEGFRDNGLYASAPGLPDGEGGTVHVEGGRYSNNNVASVRLGSVGSTVRDARIVVDETPPTSPVNVRGIRLRRGRDHLVEDCELVYTADAGDSFGAIVFHPDCGGATVRDTDIAAHRDTVPGIFSPYNATASASSQVFENVTITGTASGNYAAEFVGRSGVVFRDCEIRQTGEQRDGVRFANRDGCRIVDSRIEVTGIPVLVDDAVAEIRDTTVITPDGERFIEEETVDDRAVVP